MATKSVRYSDINTMFAPHPVSGDLARITEFEAVRRSIRNLIMTDKYERILDPKIGSNIRHILFEPMDGSTTAVLQSYIRETINNYEPRALLQDVVVTPDYDNQIYYVSIQFAVTFSESSTNVEFFLNRVR